MKKKLFALLTFVFMVSLVLFACDPIKLDGIPSPSAPVYGNGGSAVVKGEYIYFANSYIDYNTLGINDNRYDKNSGQVIHAIYRTTLSEYGKLNLDEDGKPQHVELVTYSIGGYDYSGMYICGDYLYYSSPFSSANSDGSVKKGNIRFERVKLDGTSREVVYSCSSYDSKSDYDIVYIGGVTYIVVLDSNGDLTVISCKGGNIKKNTLATGVTSFAVYEQNNIDSGESLSSFYDYVYYVLKDSNGKNNLYRIALNGEDNAQLILGIVSEDMSVISVKNNRVYFLQDNKLCSFNFNNNSFEKKQYSTAKADTTSSDSGIITSFLPLDDNPLERGIVGIYYDGTTYAFKVFNGIGLVYDLGLSYSEKPIMYATQDGEVYFSVSGTLYAVSLSFENIDSSVIVTVLSQAIISPSFSTTGSGNAQFDFDGDRIYVFDKIGSTTNSYLTMYMIGSPYIDEDGKIVGHYMGHLTSEDYDIVYKEEN